MPARSVGRSRAASALLGGALVLAAHPAAADETEPIRVVYRAPPDCPDEAAFTGQVTARTRRARRAEQGEAARTFTISIASASAQKTRGKLTIDDPRGPSSSREVSGETCVEVVSALGLITALAIDPRASTAPTLPPAPPSPPSPPAPPAPREHGPPPPRYDALPWWGPIGTPLPVIPEPPPEPSWRLAWGLSFGGESGVAPSVFFTLGGFAEVARVSAGVLSPAFRLGLFGGDSGFVGFGAGHFGRFALTAGRAEGCPVRLSPLPFLAAYPCVRFDAGKLDSIGVARVTVAPSAHPWAAPGAVARLQGELFHRVLVEVEGGVNFPLVRDTFSFAAPPGPPQPVHQVPVAGGLFAAGVGTHFP